MDPFELLKKSDDNVGTTTAGINALLARSGASLEPVAHGGLSRVATRHFEFPVRSSLKVFSSAEQRRTSVMNRYRFTPFLARILWPVGQYPLAACRNVEVNG